LKALFVGDLNEGTRSLFRAKVIKNLGVDLITISNTRVPFIAGIHRPSFVSRVANRIGFTLDEENINKKIILSIKKHPDLNFIWVDKSMMLRPSTLVKIKNINDGLIIASISEDDMFAAHNQNYFYKKTLKLFDIVFTTKVYNLSELKLLGARKTSFFLDSYYEDLHRPLPDYLKIESKMIDVSFIGSYEAERAATLLWLSKQGVRIVVAGNGWEGFRKKNIKNITFCNGALYGDDYVKFINQSKINICFLRKINRDQVTSRTMEIVGAGGFLLAERTERHQDLFKEGLEAEFFSGNEELLKKINEYLGSPERILRVSMAGRCRAVKSGYGMKYQTSQMIKQIAEISR
jgi:spore maturation protein CgeB